MHALPHHLNDFADALSVLPARDRAAAAKAILGECADMTARMSALHGCAYSWGQFLQPVCLARKNAFAAANPGQFALARIDTRDGLQAWETAIYALTDLIRADEREAA
jgi:hypothetical protein